MGIAGMGACPQYICIAPDEAPEVFDWLNDVSDADHEIAEIHLRLCFHCQEAVATMMTLDKEFRARVLQKINPLGGNSR